MTTTILTPFDLSKPVNIGRRRFWKQILPVTSIDYDGEQIDFDPSFHKNLELAYTDKVFDQIPLVFANGENQHNEDPRNYGGEILKMENRGAKGTWALIEADRATARQIHKNPKLGVSARIQQGVTKAGKTYPQAVRHVLMTMFPRVQGMEPWQAVDLSDGEANVEVVDLTDEQFEQEEGDPMGTKTAKKTATTKANGPIDLSKLTDDEFQSFLDLAGKAGLAVADPEEDEEDLDEEVDSDEDDEDEDLDKPRKKKSKKVVTIENESEESGGSEEDEDETTEVELSKPVEDPRFTEFLKTHNQSQWDGLRTKLVEDGIPPFMVDLAEPVLTQPEVLDLSDSDGKKTSARKVVLGILGGMKNIIDLTGEEGHMVDLAAVEDKDADAFVEAWQKQYR